jgi:hypothetical protein
LGITWFFIKKWNKNHKFIHHVMRLAMGITRIEPALLPPCVGPYFSNACGFRCYYWIWSLRFSLSMGYL